MVKKLLILFLVLGLATAASATTLTLTRSGSGTLNASDTEKIYVYVNDSDMDSLAATLTVTNGTFTANLIGQSDADDYGVYVSTTPTAWGGGSSVAGGWQTDLSSDSVRSVSNTKAEIGLGMFGSTLYGPTDTAAMADIPYPNEGGAFAYYTVSLAYVELQAAGTGDMVLSWVNGSQFGTSSRMTDGSLPTFGASLTIPAVPEPMTIALLGLGGLLLRRRR
jgi:hypothetical protein